MRIGHIMAFKFQSRLNLRCYQLLMNLYRLYLWILDWEQLLTRWSNIKYDDNDEIYMRSAMKIFLSKHNLIKYLSRCMIMSRDVKTHLTNTKLPFIVSISIYCVMFEEKLSSKEIIEKLCSYFIINPRTLEKKIRQFKHKK